MEISRHIRTHVGFASLHGFCTVRGPLTLVGRARSARDPAHVLGPQLKSVAYLTVAQQFLTRKYSHA